MALCDGVPFGLVLVDREGIIYFANRGATMLLGLDPLTLRGRSLFEVLPAWKCPAMEGCLKSWSNGHAETASPLDLPGPGNRLMRVWATPCFHPDYLDAIVLSVVDFSELTELQQRLQRAEYQASIGKLARGIAHELNNPLDGVLRYTHVALTHLPEDSVIREHLLHVKEGLDRMVKAVKAFLEFSRQATAPCVRVAQVNELVEGALLLIQHRAKFQQIRVVTQLEPHLPPITDAGLQYAIVNLIKNAFDAMPRGGTLTVATRHAAAEIEIEVTDTGCGIPDELRAKIFEPFFTNKPIHQGSGLGLTIAKEVIERMDGRLVWSSQVGVGSSFRIFLQAEGARRA